MMAGSMQRALVLILSVCALGVQAALPDLRGLLTSNNKLTPKGQAAVDAGSTNSSDGTKFNVQMAPGIYGMTVEQPQYFKDKGSQRQKIKYGPFNVPGMDTNNGMIAYLQLGASMPCADCTITWMQAGLEYPNGTYANSNTSLWLHHTVFINTAHPDTVCGTDYYGVGQRWFASGNERTITDFCIEGTTPAGYYLGLLDYHIIEAELMNQQMDAQEAVLTVEYEFIMGQPEGFYSAKPTWLDIAGCYIESDMPPLSNTTFHYHLNQTYQPDWHGALLGMGAHLHDGGTHIDVTNKGVEQCNSQAYYGSPGYIGPDMDMDGGETEHISYMSSCYAPYVGMVEEGDEWNITAWYDFTKHTPMTNTDGSLQPIMGISVVYAALNMTAEEMAGYRGKANLNANPPQPPYATPLMDGPTTVPGPTMTMSMSMMDADSTMSGMTTMTMPME